MCPLGDPLGHIYVYEGVGGDVTEGRCFLHGSEDDWEPGGMVQRQGKSPFFLHGWWTPSSKGGCSPVAADAAQPRVWQPHWKWELSFLQPQPPTPNVRLTPNLAKAGFNVPGNR